MSTSPLVYYGAGKRKSSVARVHLRPGKGEFQLNDRGLDEYFGGIEALKQVVKQPFSVTETNDRFDVVATIHGGGANSQAGAVRHGISRALCEFNLELLITTPVRSWELMTGKLLPYVAIVLVQVTLVLGVGSLLFDVPVNGSLADLYLAALLFIAATLTLGLVISTLARTQFQAFQLAFFTMLPSILLSGFMFPFDGMPRAAQWIAQVLPLTHFNDLARGIVLRGAPITELGRPAAKLAVFLVVALAIATLRFRKRLD